MGGQQTFASIAWSAKGKITRREAVSGRDGCSDSMAASAWADRAALSQGGQGRQPLRLEKMLRIYFPQQCFNLSDPHAEDAIYDSEQMRRFAQVELGDEGLAQS